ncbi:RNA-binding protein 26 isoform X2 [Leptidea sinapis]|uniref:RNA-binding protein 26 isoform X2 n=1 Tax=Leptidea sinapis TaxID=189913 RepID=UPI0021C2D222|nr:RNA-binding protein 26 isoform X2 [Leptidea sinapis]
MLIENPDAFKSWLTSILEPLCDADPAALAKYVYALVKKDKPLDELREGMLDQLDVFLQQETKPFVEMLFKALDGHEYLVSVDKKEPTPPPEPVVTEKEPELENHVPAVTSEEQQEASRTVRNRSPILATTEPPPRHRVVVPRRAHPPHEQTLVKVLPTELLEEQVDLPRRRERRAEVLRDKEERRRRRSRSRSWERRTRARRHPRDEHADRRYEKRRGPSRSPSPRGRYRNRSPPALIDRQTSRSRSRSPAGIRDRELERERERLRVPRELERDRMSRDREHRDRISRSRDRERSRDRSTSPKADTRLELKDMYKRRCRDFDVKGYCMRGDLCEWDHGVDPVVLEDAALTRVLTLPPTVPEYNPATPDIWVGGGFNPFPAPPPHLGHPHHLTPRELVPIPRVRDDMPIGAVVPPPPRHPPSNKKPFDFNRLGGPRSQSSVRPAMPPPPMHLGGKCSLQVSKVPVGLNDITHLNKHFSKFGKIVNIQVCFENDPEAALITFSNPAEANVAYKSTEAVLNNRFIKVFWYNPENKHENGANNTNNVQTDRHPMSLNKVFINRDNIKASEEKQQLLQQQQQQLKEKAKELRNGENETENKETKPADKSKQVMEMHRRAQALLQTQLAQQKLLIGRLESGNVTEQQKGALMEAINAAQEGIEKLRKELVAYNGMIKHLQEEAVSRSLSRLQLNQANSKKPKTAAEAQKEILDAELDIITKQQEGQDVTELAKKIVDMRRQMAVQFPTHLGARRIHSRGGRFNPAMRFTRNTAAGKPPSLNQSVDHRPRTLLVSGFETDELEPLCGHFARFGEIVGKQVNMSVPELTIQYKLRSQAELALLRGRHYSDRTLSITWVNSNKPLAPAEPVSAPTTVSVHNGDVTQDSANETQTQSQQQTDEPLLRFDEEDEDDADEDRSWRR